MQVLNGLRIKNPGNGTYKLVPTEQNCFSSIQIEQEDPGMPLNGTLVFSIGINNMTINIGAGERYYAMQKVTNVICTVAGVLPTDEFSICLI